MLLGTAAAGGAAGLATFLTFLLKPLARTAAAARHVVTDARVVCRAVAEDGNVIVRRSRAYQSLVTLTESLAMEVTGALGEVSRLCQAVLSRLREIARNAIVRASWSTAVDQIRTISQAVAAREALHLCDAIERRLVRFRFVLAA